MKTELFLFIRLTKEQMRNEIPELQQLPDYWLIKQLFLCILQTFPFFQPSNPILLCLTHSPFPLSPSLCFT